MIRDCGGTFVLLLFQVSIWQALKKGLPVICTVLLRANSILQTLWEPICIHALFFMRVVWTSRFEKEMEVDRLLGHGGLSKIKRRRMKADSGRCCQCTGICNGYCRWGRFGNCTFASYLVTKKKVRLWKASLINKSIADQESCAHLDPKPKVAYPMWFMDSYMKGLSIERAAVESEICKLWPETCQDGHILNNCTVAFSLL